MGTNGGARPGAGRKPKAEQFKRPIAQAEKRIADRLPLLINNLFLLADGVLVQEELIPGQPIVYKRPPDRQANEYLINRIMGKPTDRKEHTFPDKPIEEMTDDELKAIRDS